MPPTSTRRPLRLPGYDYALPGAYFVTVCLAPTAPPLAARLGDWLRLTDSGARVGATWRGLPAHYGLVTLDAFVVMPDHVHGIVWLHAAPGADGRAAGPLAAGDAGDAGAAGHAGRRRPAVGAGLRPARAVPAPPPTAGLPEVIRAFKSFSARAINADCGTPGAPVWQRNYFEHIIRTERALHRIREYIRDNPARWVARRSC